MIFWILRKICRNLVKQGHNHEFLIREYYRIMWEEAKKEFGEDSLYNLRIFLQDCHDDVLYKCDERNQTVN